MFILRKHNVNPQLPWYFAAYNESATSEPTTFDGKTSATLFLSDKNSAERAKKLGWIDETEKYNNHLKSLQLSQNVVSKEQPKKETVKKSKRKYTKRAK